MRPAFSLLHAKRDSRADAEIVWHELGARYSRRNFMPLRCDQNHGAIHPNEMDMIWHEVIDRTEQSLPGRSVQHHFAKAAVKICSEPAGSSIGEGIAQWTTASP